jgi:competence protein ComEC
MLAAASGALLCYAARRPDRTPRLRATSAGLVAVGVVGAGFGLAIALRADAVGRHPITAAFGTAAPVTVTPSESALSLGHGRLMFRATLQRLRADEISGRVVVFARASDFGSETGSETGTVMVGQPMRFTARISHPTRHDLTVAVLNATGRPTLGRAGAVQLVAHTVRSRFAATVRDVLPAEQAAMLPALVLGDTSAVTAQTGSDFRAAGMTHLTAVSGANVTIVCAAVLFSARLIGPRTAVVLAAVALVAFVIVVQPTASVLRAAVMGAIALVGMLSSRRRQAIPALCATVLVLMAVAPHLAVDVGFALSVLATAALVVIAPVWSRRLAGRGCPKPLADALAVAWAAHVVTAPLIAGISGRVSLVAAVANLAVAPLIAPITVLGSAAAVLCVLWPVGAQLLIRFTGPELWWVLSVARWAAGVPAATVPVPAGVAGVLLVGGATVLLLLLALLLRRRPWFRATVRVAAVVAVICLLGWTLSELLDPRTDWSALRDTIVG